MRIFALQTDVNEIKRRFCHEDKGECVVYMTYYHGLSFLFAIFREILITLVLLMLGVTGWYFGWPMAWTLGILFVTWVVFVLFNVVKAYIDWSYDFIMVTTDKVILVDQSSIFRQEIKPIHVENIGGISTETQFWDIFPFGRLTIHLKEGLGGDLVTLKYVPRARELASRISDVVTKYQRHGFTPEAQEGSSTPPLDLPPQGSNLGGGQQV